MSKFITSLLIDQITDEIFELASPLIYQSDILGGLKVEVPAGFQSDGASVPRLPIVYALYGNRAHHEAVLHDFFYRIDSVPEVSFKIANKLFLEAMEVRGKPFYIRWPMYFGVVAGGWTAYHKKLVGDKLT